ncbi:hypothetical protein QOT17_011207 [Balamuthia mandrillaris]
MALFSLAIVSICVLFLSQGFSLLSEALLRVMIGFKIPQQFMSALFKELSILGVISFFLFALTYSKILPEHLQEGVEIVHITLFVTSLLYIFLVGFLLFLSVFWVRRFKLMEHKVITGVKEERKRTFWKRVKKFFSSRRAISRPIYTALRRKCIETHGLSPDFNYYRYIRESLQRVVLATMEIDYKMWLLVIIYAAIVDIEAVFWPFRIHTKIVKHKESEDGDLIYEELFIGPLLLVIAVLEWALVILSFPLGIKLRCIIRQTIKKEVTHVLPIEDRAYDKKHVHNSFLYNFQRCCCPCCLPHISETQKLFWFKSKGFTRSIIQVMVLLQAFSFAIILINARYLGEEILLLVLSLVPIPYILFFAVPSLLPLFTVAAYSGDSADRRLLRRLQKNNAHISRWPQDDGEDDASELSLLHGVQGYEIEERKQAEEEEDDDDEEGAPRKGSLQHLYLPVNHSLEEPLLGGSRDKSTLFRST